MPRWLNIRKPINAKHCINQRKDKYHVIITIHKEETFDKIYHPFMIKTLNELGMETNYLNLIKAVYQQPRVNITLNGQRLRTFPL